MQQRRNSVPLPKTNTPMRHFIPITIATPLFFSFFIFGLIGSAHAQVRIAEVAPNGTELTDEDSDLPDWIELFNSGTQPVNLLDYALSDDNNAPNKWRLPDVTLAAGESKIVFASGKNRPESPGNGSGNAPIHHWETAVQDGHPIAYTIGGPGAAFWHTSHTTKLAARFE
jgi:hypothetical protein